MASKAIVGGIGAQGLTRRTFVAGAIAAASGARPAGVMAQQGQPDTAATPPAITRKFKIGLVGCGGRGSWIPNFFKAHGGFEVHAAADYFPDAVERFGNAFGVDPARRFTGLSSCEKLIASGVDVVVLQNLPYFHPRQAEAAIAAGKHVYMAKPVACDVPGTLKIGKLGAEATRKNLCFMVDYQMPNDPVNIEVRQRIRDGGLGKLAYVCTYGVARRWPEPDANTPREHYLRSGLWLHHVELGADACVSYDIHAIDAAVWALGFRPAAAMGLSATRRSGAFLTGRDVVQVVMQCDDGLIWTHQHQSLANQSHLTNSPNLIGGLLCRIHGDIASATITYAGKAFVHGGPKHFVGSVESLYNEGVRRNVAELYTNLVEGRFENATVSRSVDSNLTALLAREAGYRQGRLTMDELLRENRQLEFDFSGFKS